jgi:YhcH/YjgK/YiaL family protein
MIKITNFEELNNYFKIPKEALDFLKSIDMETECKRYDFSDDCYVNVQSVDTKPETPLMEAHVKFVDIQCLIDGEEKIYYIEKSGLTETTPYSEKADYALYDLDKNSTEVTYKSGEGIVLFPNEAHTPNLAVTEPKNNKKAVIKIRTSRIK